VTVYVHPSAHVDPNARLAAGVRIGPFCYVGADVEIGAGTELVAHVSVLGPCRLGAHNRVFPHATLGAEPQDRSFRGERSELVVGDHNEIRESVTIHRGTNKGGGVTRVGSHCLLMVGAHVAHDCTLQDQVVLTNQVSLAGHVHVEAQVTCGGHAAIAPFVRLQTLSFVAAAAMVERHVPPFLIVAGNRARVRGLNNVGLARAGVPEESLAALKLAFKHLFKRGTPLSETLATLPAALVRDAYVARLAQGVRAAGDQPLRRSLISGSKPRA
jgi:UDP-N-acetylglucosamine acyltransferase